MYSKPKDDLLKNMEQLLNDEKFKDQFIPYGVKVASKKVLSKEEKLKHEVCGELLRISAALDKLGLEKSSAETLQVADELMQSSSVMPEEEREKLTEQLEQEG